jgi:hypothetical protein
MPAQTSHFSAAARFEWVCRPITPQSRYNRRGTSQTGESWMARRKLTVDRHEEIKRPLSFEPASATFPHLLRNVSGLSNVIPLPCSV